MALSGLWPGREGDGIGVNYQASFRLTPGSGGQPSVLYVTSSYRLTCRFAASGGRLRAARLPQPRTSAHVTGFAGRSGGITPGENPVNLSAGMCLMAHP